MILHGDLFDVLPTLDAESFSACVTDPPYGIGFMGKAWDTFAPDAGNARNVPNRVIDSDNPNLKGRKRAPASSPSAVEYDRSLHGQREFQAWTERWAREVYRVLKPGAHLIVCGAPRSFHRMTCGLEDAGFVVRDCSAWLFSSGFPKSHNFGCKCGGNALPYNHDDGESAAERDVRRVRGADVSAAVNAPAECREILLDGVPEQGASQRGTARPQPETAGREQPRLEWGQLHRAGEGLSDDSTAGPSASAAERLCAGTHRRGGADAGPSPEGERGSASQGSRSSEQLAGQSAHLRLPSRTLDRGASDRGTRCPRCGGLTSARGLGTALKPAHEPIVIAWKPFKGTIADNYIKHGTGALNIDACRLNPGEMVSGGGNGKAHNGGGICAFETKGTRPIVQPHDLGRWPANVLLDEDAAIALDEQTGELGVSSGGPSGRLGGNGIYGDFTHQARANEGGLGDSGGASRFYYVAKPSREERDYGCEVVADALRRRRHRPHGRQRGPEQPTRRGRTHRRRAEHPSDRQAG
jgi:hypothetical protein